MRNERLDPVANIIPYRVLTTETVAIACTADPHFWDQVVGPWLQQITDRRGLFMAPPWINPDIGLVDIIRTQWLTEWSTPEIVYYVAADPSGAILHRDTDGKLMTVRSDCPVPMPTGLVSLRTPWRPTNRAKQR